MADTFGFEGGTLRVLTMEEVVEAYSDILDRELSAAMADDYRSLQRLGEAYWMGVAEDAPDAAARIAMRIKSNMQRGFDEARADKTCVPGLVWSYIQKPCYQELMEGYPDWEEMVDLPPGLTHEKLGKLARPVVRARFKDRGVRFVR